MAIRAPGRLSPAPRCREPTERTQRVRGEPSSPLLAPVHTRGPRSAKRHSAAAGQDSRKTGSTAGTATTTSPPTRHQRTDQPPSRQPAVPTNATWKAPSAPTAGGYPAEPGPASLHPRPHTPRDEATAAGETTRRNRLGECETFLPNGPKGQVTPRSATTPHDGKVTPTWERE